MRAKAEVVRDGEDPLGIFERTLAPQFLRPWGTVVNVAEVLRMVPTKLLSGLTGVYLMAGTSKQQRLRSITYGMYFRDRIYLFPIPAHRMEDGWTCSSKPSEIQRLTKFGAQVKPNGHKGFTVSFDELSLMNFYLYDVLLHEIGHHADRLNRGGNAERYAKWFAQFQQAHLPPANG